MARKAAELSPLAVSRLKEPGLYFVGGVAGLALQVLPTGGRTWILRATVGGRRRDMGLGGFPDVTLAGAREAARAARQLIRTGVDPIEEAKAARKALQAATAKGLSFREAAEAFIASQEAAWRNAKHKAQWSSTLTAYAYPVIGGLSVADIELAHVSKVLEPIWTTKTETASRLRGRIEQILDWATARGYRSGLNPARWRGHLDKLFPRPPEEAAAAERMVAADHRKDLVTRLAGFPSEAEQATDRLASMNAGTVADMEGAVDAARFFQQAGHSIMIVENAATSGEAPVSAKVLAANDRLKVALVRKQRALFPEIRRTYAAYMSDAVSGAVANFRAVGPGAKTLRGASPSFTSRDVVSNAHHALMVQATQFRFAKAEYVYSGTGASYVMTVKGDDDGDIG